MRTALVYFVVLLAVAVCLAVPASPAQAYIIDLLWWIRR
jgi:Na+/H+ antiporter NhaC